MSLIQRTVEFEHNTKVLKGIIVDKIKTFLPGYYNCAIDQYLIKLPDTNIIKISPDQLKKLL